tara:strand:+ start:391 stop:525 length:135 start_codon:yes stop_codon:yes gene_type:complete
MNKNRPYFNSYSADIADLIDENIDNLEELKILHLFLGLFLLQMI